MPEIIFEKDNIKVTALKEFVFVFEQPILPLIIIPDPVEPVPTEPVELEVNDTINSNTTSLSEIIEPPSPDAMKQNETQEK